MSTYAQRSGPAYHWEAQLVTMLQGVGWLAAPFGQQQIPSEIREWLPRCKDDYGRPPLLRWTPDIIAVRPSNPPFACLIDAKTESKTNQTGPNYSVEINAVDAGLAIVRDWYVPLFYVWPDFGVMTPQIVLNRWSRKLDGDGAQGSGTAFYLVAKKWRLSISDVFPPLSVSA